MRKSPLLAIVLLATVSACSIPEDFVYRGEGAGVELYTAPTARNTQNIKDYFKQLCDQAGYSNNNCTPAPGEYANATWKLLVETGYNDIDYKCDKYLNWIEEKRSQKIAVDSSSSAVQALTTGVLTAVSSGALEIALTALSLDFVKSVYDSYHNSILLGLEASTIKEVVNRRRGEHRQSFSTAQYDNRAAAIFALRRYLTYCTPQAILTDVNSLSRVAARGNEPDPIGTEAERGASLLSARISDAPDDRTAVKLINAYLVKSPSNVKTYLALAKRHGLIIANGPTERATAVLTAANAANAEGNKKIVNDLKLAGG